MNEASAEVLQPSTTDRSEEQRGAPDGSARAKPARRKREPKAPRKSAARKLFKFAGGKDWVLEQHDRLLPRPEDVRVMHECFVGSGAVASRYLGKTAVRLNDKNPKIMAVYEAVMKHPEELVAVLRDMVYEAGPFYETRRRFNESWKGADLITRAAWFIYLNRTCFNGLYRENLKGKFNVPIGRYKNPLICDEETILSWSARLRASREMLSREACDAAMLTEGDFRPALDEIGPGDFGFLDPPYVPANSTTAKFTEYQPGGFNLEDQVRLAQELPKVDARGGKFLLTNAVQAKYLYEARWHVKEVNVPRAINSKAGKRGDVVEILVANYALD